MAAGSAGSKRSFAITATTAIATAGARFANQGSMPTSSGSIQKPTTPQRMKHAMPSLTFSTLLVANGTTRPLDGWQYEYLPWPAEVQVLARSTLVGLVATYTSGSETIVEESPVQAGGTIGVIPSPLNTPVQGWIGAAGDRLKLNYRETAGTAPTVDGIIEIQPL